MLSCNFLSTKQVSKDGKLAVQQIKEAKVDNSPPKNQSKDGQQDGQFPAQKSAEQDMQCGPLIRQCTEHDCTQVGEDERADGGATN
eukprot:1159898-Pelagomonas_calceolata.AAC.10